MGCNVAALEKPDIATLRGKAHSYLSGTASFVPIERPDNRLSGYANKVPLRGLLYPTFVPCVEQSTGKPARAGGLCTDVARGFIRRAIPMPHTPSILHHHQPPGAILRCNVCAAANANVIIIVSPYPGVMFMKILSVVGARPQFIKAAPVGRALHQAGITEVLLHTGQHYDHSMSTVFFTELGIPEPQYNLGVGSSSHAAQTAAMLTGIEDVLLTEQPDTVLIYGDTNSTLAGALAAAKLGVPVAHVEAGLRSYNRSMPEEINRVVADSLSSLLFCPTDVAASNLRREGITVGVHVVGDVMYDAVLWAVEHSGDNATAMLSRLDLTSKDYLLATIHRASNTDNHENLVALVSALNASGEKVVFPVHPRTSKALEGAGIVLSDNILAIEPVPYLEMLALESHARAILTDSGGVQKEALWLAVPCITLREETEWVETVECGWNTLTGTDPQKILSALQSPTPTTAPSQIYGDGHAAERIASILNG
jgi:UDP-GlcNAc3NAcA epimerase